MKTTKKSIAIIFSFLAICFIIASCSKKADVAPPTITLNAPAENAEVTIGQPMPIKIALASKSKEKLKSYKINIHSNFDGHEHKSSLVSSKSSNENVIFNKEYQIPTGKTELNVDTTIDIPSAAQAGKYHMLIFCTDAAGNEAKILRNIVLKTAQ